MEQSAITADASPFALYVILNVKQLDKQQLVIERCKELGRLAEQINQQQPEAHIKVAVGFGRKLLTQIKPCSEHSEPEYFEPQKVYDPNNCGLNFSAMLPRGKGELYAPASDEDLLLHIHSNRHDLNFFLFRQWLTPIANLVVIVDETYGYRYLDSRDLTGFVDGTENPKTKEDKAQIALINAGATKLTGSSYSMVQRFIHKLPAWDLLEVAKQEQIIGRTKEESEELHNVPTASHVGRVDLKEGDQSLKIVRHSLPYGTVSNEHGLLFIAYCNRQYNFDRMLDSMYGHADKQTDNLLKYTRAVSGSYFFMPSIELLETF